MTDIINAISEYIHNFSLELPIPRVNERVKNWGFVELANRESKGKKESTQPIPMTINGTGERKQVSLDDKYQFISWIRWVNPVRPVKLDEDTWGLRQGRRKGTTLRIIIAHRVALGEALIHDLVNSFPESIYLTGYEFVHLEEAYIDPDHEQIYKTELGETVYELHRFDWNIYAIDLTVEFIRCPNTATTSSPD